VARRAPRGQGRRVLAGPRPMGPRRTCFHGGPPHPRRPAVDDRVRVRGIPCTRASTRPARSPAAGSPPQKPEADGRWRGAEVVGRESRSNVSPGGGRRRRGLAFATNHASSCHRTRETSVAEVECAFVTPSTAASRSPCSVSASTTTGACNRDRARRGGPANRSASIFAANAASSTRVAGGSSSMVSTNSSGGRVATGSCSISPRANRCAERARPARTGRVLRRRAVRRNAPSRAQPEPGRADRRVRFPPPIRRVDWIPRAPSPATTPKKTPADSPGAITKRRRGAARPAAKPLPAADPDNAASATPRSRTTADDSRRQCVVTPEVARRPAAFGNDNCPARFEGRAAGPALRGRAPRVRTRARVGPRRRRRGPPAPGHRASASRRRCPTTTPTARRLGRCTPDHETARSRVSATANRHTHQTRVVPPRRDDRPVGTPQCAGSLGFDHDLRHVTTRPGPARPSGVGRLLPDPPPAPGGRRPVRNPASRPQAVPHGCPPAWTGVRGTGGP